MPGALLARPTAVAWLACSLLGCGAPKGPAPGQPSPIPVVVQATSNHAIAVDVFVTAKGYSRRLGTLHPGIPSTFEIPSPALVNGGVVEIEIRSSAAPPFRSGQLLLAAGDVVVITAEPRLFASTVVVRSP